MQASRTNTGRCAPKSSANRQALSDEDLVSYAKGQGVDIGTWETCMASDTYARKVEADMRGWRETGHPRNNPLSYSAKTDPDDPTKFQALDLLEGAYPFSAFQEKFEGTPQRVARGTSLEFLAGKAHTGRAGGCRP